MGFRSAMLRRAGANRGIPAPPVIAGLVGLYWHGYGVSTDGGGDIVSWAPAFWDASIYGASPQALAPTGSTNPVAFAAGAAWDGSGSRLVSAPGIATNEGGRDGFALAHRTHRTSGPPWAALIRGWGWSAIGTGGGFNAQNHDAGEDALRAVYQDDGGGASVSALVPGTYAATGTTVEATSWVGSTTSRNVSVRDPGLGAPYDSSASGIVSAVHWDTGTVLGFANNSAPTPPGWVTDVLAVYADALDASQLAALANYMESLP